MDVNDLFSELTDEGDWRVTIGTYSNEDEVLFAVRTTVDDCSYGAVSNNLKQAIELSVESALQGDVNHEENLSEAARVLKTALEEIGFDKAIALLERLSNM